MRLAVIQKELCHPDKCGDLCGKLCPVNRQGVECIAIGKKASIDASTCIGCGICPKRCPFGAISIINLPEELDKDLLHKHGKNGFALYRLPMPRFGSVLGILGKNGIGKSTSLKILSGKMTPNLGYDSQDVANERLRNYFRGSELLTYFEKLPNLKISIKPQNIFDLMQFDKVSDLLDQAGANIDQKVKKELIQDLAINSYIHKDMSKLSGGELQKVAIAVACLKDADIYFFDEPLAYLDIVERIRVSDFIRKLVKNEKAVVVIDHDLLLLDYMTDLINIVYGKPSCYGIIAPMRASKNAINSYLEGFLRDEQMKFRDKPIKFNFGVRDREIGQTMFDWPAFTKSHAGFEIKVAAGSLAKKSIVGIAGKNATGKTTFVKCLAGLYETDNKDLNLKLKFSHKPQYVNASEETVMEVLKKDNVNKRIISLLSLEPLMMRRLDQLSGGELQKVAVASCLAKDADIYLIDEPSAHLDVEERLQVADAIQETMMEKEAGAFVVDHDILFLSYLADSMIVFSGLPSRRGNSSEVYPVVQGLNELLKLLQITVRRDKESGRPRINSKDSVLDREQREKGSWFAE